MLTIALIIGLCLNCTGGEGAWNLYADIVEEGIKMYYDTERISRISKNDIRVWIKEVHLGEQGRKEIIHFRAETGLSIKGFENYAFALEQWAINCIKKKHKLLTVVYYDNNNRILDSYHSDTGTWVVIVPHSAGEMLFEIVCRRTSLW